MVYLPFPTTPIAGPFPPGVICLGRDITLNGGTLRMNANVTIHFNRQFMIGPNGATIDTQNFPNVSHAASNENHGPGDLTKIGSWDFYRRCTVWQQHDVDRSANYQGRYLANPQNGFGILRSKSRGG